MNSSRYQHTERWFVTAGLLLVTLGWTVEKGAAEGGSGAHSIRKPSESKAIQDQATDLTDRGGIHGKYDVVPVRRGELVDDKGGRLTKS